MITFVVGLIQKRFLPFALLLFLTLSSAVDAYSMPSETALSLNDVFTAALQRADTVTIDAELIRQAEEQQRQANAVMLPTVIGSGTLTRQQQVSNGLSSNIYPTYQPLVKVTATQPLFVGLRDLAALRQGEQLIGTRKLDKDAAIIQLYKDVATNFFAIIKAEKDAANIVTEIDYYEKRIAELERFKKIGRSQSTDVLTAQVSQASLRAIHEQILGQINANREILSVLTGLDSKVALQSNLSDDISKDAQTLPQYLALLDQRPDVKAASMRQKSSEESIEIARAGHLPTVQLSGNYYLERYGPAKDVKWDVSLGVMMPIYAGGLVTSQVEAATSAARQAGAVVSQARRLAEQEIRAAFATLQADKQQLLILRTATELARKNYDIQTNNYRLGLVTNLDVLTALTAFQEDQRAMDGQRYNLQADFEKLEAAVGRRPIH